MKKQLATLLLLIMVPVWARAFAQEASIDDGLEKKTLAEILEEEKARKYVKIDDFLQDFDKGFDKSTGEKFEDLLKDESLDMEDQEVSTDSFESFNEAFDKIIEEDLADFKMFEIKDDSLGEDLLVKETSAKAQKPN